MIAPNASPTPPRRWPTVLAVLLLVAASAAAGTGLAHLLRQPSKPTVPPAAGKLPAHLFRDWGRPDLVIVLSGQEHGYLLPCGCSSPQVGGLERRYNLLQLLRERGWPVAAVDLGDVPQKHGPAGLPNVQGLLKYDYSMRALKAMDYAAVGVGEYEANQTFIETVGAYALNNDGPPYLLAANLVDPKKVCADAVYPWKPVDVKGSSLKLGVTAVVGPTLQEKLKDPDVSFTKTPQALPGVLKQMDQAKTDVRVLLYHGSLTKGAEGWPPQAIACAKAFPQFQVILALGEEDEPSAEPAWVDQGPGRPKTLVVGLGHKGKYVGVVGVYRTGKAEQPFDLRYELVKMDTDFVTPPEREQGHPIVALMENYTRDLRDRKDANGKTFLQRYPQARHPLQVAVAGKEPTYVGTARCGDCHEHAYKVWQGSKHSHAYQTLVDAKRPSNRQYDPECIVCHTVGFGYQGGFVDGTARNGLLKNVGCESCHGPGSVHANNPQDETWQRLLNPWKAPANEGEEAKKQRVLRINSMCQGCHDVDNDVTWVNKGFERKWPAIDHPTPR